MFPLHQRNTLKPTLIISQKLLVPEPSVLLDTVYSLHKEKPHLHQHIFKMPVAVTPPAVTVKDLSVPKTSFTPTQNLHTLNTKRKIICFSGTHADSFPSLSLLCQSYGDGGHYRTSPLKTIRTARKQTRNRFFAVIHSSKYICLHSNSNHGH